ncbi:MULTISPECIES: hypothetical protein [Bacillus cereus group]|uniref:Uncharacterized protein n=1 Tax=Bacillus thuringiensis TaxID=1428 RepID=A0A9X6WHN0_BACTU|nr:MULTISPECIES: hypothetical protein [Bacillus cereus group]PFJ31007.1 hypothetical protein COJ15_30200 [Bacillus thuringiensis]PGP12811.1 hypothetical protein COA01_33895 [Bacillus cereus]
MLYLNQIELIYHNAPTISISKYTSRSSFFPFFLTHLQEYFKNRGKNLYIEEPFLEGEEVEESQAITVYVDGKFFGQLYFLLDDYSLDVNLFFYCEEFSHKYFLMENEVIDEIPFHTYYFWLGALFGIHDSYLDDYKSRKKEKRR